MTSVLLQSAFYTFGNALGGFSAIALTLIFVIVWIWVMFRYLNTSDLKG